MRVKTLLKQLRNEYDELLISEREYAEWSYWFHYLGDFHAWRRYGDERAKVSKKAEELLCVINAIEKRVS